jgi:hypothetical protein
LDEGVEGFKAELVAGLEMRWCDGERVRAHRNKGGNGGSVFRPRCGESEREREAEA